MSFFDKRKEKKLLNIRRDVLENRKLFSFEDAVGYANHTIFQDCHIMQDMKNGMPTGKYYLISEEMARKELENKSKQSCRKSLQEKLHFDVSEVRYNNYQSAPRYVSRQYGGR